MAETNARRLEFVDALRGAAAIYVIVLHVAQLPQPAISIPRWLEPMVLNGGSGVTLFFLLSGFTLYYTLDARRRESDRTTRFYIRRVFRIVPLYYVWLVIMLAWAYGFNPLHGWVSKHLALWLFFLFNFIPSTQGGLVMASWTLGVEMLVYLLFPLAFAFVDSRRRAIGLLVVTAIAAIANYFATRHILVPQWRHRWLSMSVLTHLPIFAVGILAFFLYRWLQGRELLARRCAPFFLCIGAIGFVLVPFAISAVGPYAPIQIYPMSIVYLLIVLGLAFAPAAMLINRFTVFLGNISYSTYLNHVLAILILQPVYRRICENIRWPGLHLVVCVVVTLVVVISVSYFTYRFIEQPGIRAGSKLIRRFC